MAYGPGGDHRACHTAGWAHPRAPAPQSGRSLSVCTSSRPSGGAEAAGPRPTLGEPTATVLGDRTSGGGRRAERAVAAGISERRPHGAPRPARSSRRWGLSGPGRDSTRTPLSSGSVTGDPELTGARRRRWSSPTYVVISILSHVPSLTCQLAGCPHKCGQAGWGLPAYLLQQGDHALAPRGRVVDTLCLEHAEDVVDGHGRVDVIGPLQRTAGGSEGQPTEAAAALPL